MSDSPERLRAFRASYEDKAAGGRQARVQWVVMASVFAVLSVTAMVVFSLRGQSGQSGSPGERPPDELRTVAGYLAQKNMPIAALDVYDQYLATAVLGPEARAKVCYSVAEVAIDGEAYERALAYLYEAEVLDPDTELKEAITDKIALCLEKLGRDVDLRRELRRRTAVSRAPDTGGDEVVLAKVGDHVITDRDLELELEGLPPAVRDQFSTPEQQAALLRDMVAERALLGKALRLGLDEDPAVMDQLAAMRDRLVVQELIKERVAEEMNVTADDVKRFYEAEKERFTEPARLEVRAGRAETAAEAKRLDLSEGRTRTLTAGQVVTGAVDPEGAAERIMNAEAGAVVGPIETADGWLIVQIVSKTPERVRPFAHVNEEAERLLRREKERELVEAMVTETLEQQGVEIYPERIAEAREL